MKALMQLRWILIVFLLAGSTVLIAQEKEDKEKLEEELKIKKEMLEMQKQEQMLEKQKQQQEKMIILERAHAERARESARESSRSRVFFDGDEDHFVYTSGDDFFLQNQHNSSQLTLRNTFRGGSDSSKGEFEVDDSAKMFRCMINGKVRSGKITIRLEYPNGKVFKELAITSSAQVTFNQSNSINDESRERYSGTWKYVIEAEKAEGNYTLQISTH